MTGPGSRDLRCASLLALAKRIGTQATPDLLVGLTVSDAAVKDYAVIGLAGAGADDQAWKQVLGYLRSVLRRKRRAHGTIFVRATAHAAVRELRWRRQSGPAPCWSERTPSRLPLRRSPSA